MEPIRIKKEQKKMKYSQLTFRGSKISFKEWLKLNKIVLTGKAPDSFYKFFFVYSLIDFLIGLYVGVMIT